MNPLSMLAQRFGIQEVAEDAFGKPLTAAPETLRKLLDALGIDASTEQAAEAALAAAERSEWTRVLPPVVVARDGQPLQIPVTLPADFHHFDWQLKLEDGAERSGSTAFQQLPLLSECDQDGRTLQRRALTLPAQLPWGYHRLYIPAVDAELFLIVSPGQCWLPEAHSQGVRFWGLSAQLYLLRSSHNWGIGDFTDLRQLITIARRRGAEIVGVNPLHALFPDSPEQASPYSPSDRNLLNILNIDLEAIPEFSTSSQAQSLIETETFRATLAGAREATLLAYTQVAQLKLPVLKILFDAFNQQAAPDRQRDFEAFHAERRSMLDRACIFQAIRAWFAEHDTASPDGSHWPEDLRTFRASGVERWREEHADLVRFQLWMQWIADAQLAAAARAADGAAIGIYRDVAVGSHPSGAETWCYPESFVHKVHVGAPPDLFNRMGQDWGLPAMHPQRVQDCEYRPFIDLLQANMRHAGALRIDHAMALRRLYWIPQNSQPTEGAFVHYPIEDLIGILALESHRNRCLVIGEDLGTVPAGFRERMAEANILSYRVLFFERDEDGFLPADAYPAKSLSVTSSHDLATLKGWWQQADIEAKQRLNLFPSAQALDDAHQQRGRDREDLVARLQRDGLLESAPDEAAFIAAAHRFLARTNSLFTLIQIDDLAGERDQVNMPSTTSETPNWRRRQSITLEDLAALPAFSRLAEWMQQQRNAPPQAAPEPPMRLAAA